MGETGEVKSVGKHRLISQEVLIHSLRGVGHMGWFRDWIRDEVAGGLVFPVGVTKFQAGSGQLRAKPSVLPHPRVRVRVKKIGGSRVEDAAMPVDRYV